MEQITDWKALISAINDSKHIKDYVTNCYFNTHQLRDYVESGRVFNVPATSGIAFLIDWGRNYALKFCAAPDSSFELEAQEKPVVAVLAYLDGKDIYASVEKSFNSCGMQLNQTFLEFCIGRAPSEQEKRCQMSIKNLEQQGYTFSTVTLEESKTAYDLLLANIAPYDLPAYEYVDWSYVVRMAYASCIYAPSGEMCAACILPAALSGGVSAVDPNFRGLGLGNAVKYYAYHVVNDAQKQHVWISATNLVNQTLTKQMGGFDTGHRAKQYILERRIAHE